MADIDKVIADSEKVEIPNTFIRMRKIKRIAKSGKGRMDVTLGAELLALGYLVGQQLEVIIKNGEITIKKYDG